MLDIYKKLKYIILLFGFGLLWQACNFVNLHEQAPTYIHIDSFQFKQTFPYVTNSHKISTVWAYYNNSPIGIFDLPATFPVIAMGKGRLELSPGVVVNGQNNLLAQYPFYTIDTALDLTPQPGKVINYTPTTQFFSAVKVNPVWDFNTQVGFALYTGNINYQMSRVGDSLSYEGNGSGSIYITSAGDSTEDSSTTRFVIPAGASVIEFDYKCSMPFYVGLRANLNYGIMSGVNYQVGLYPSDHWQKFYMSVANFAAQYQATNYNLFIKAVLPPDQGSGRVLLDNIQLVTF